MFTILKVNNKRYLINLDTSESQQDNQCKRILKNAPQDAIIEFVDPIPSDFKPQIKLF